jgi:hypothetical protein
MLVISSTVIEVLKFKKCEKWGVLHIPFTLASDVATLAG